MTTQKTIAAALTIAGGLSMSILNPGVASASSHREAPAIAEDQYADNTDVYSFISPKNPDSLVIVANYVPLLIPSSGPNFYRFSDDVRYELHVDNDGDAKDDLLVPLTCSRPPSRTATRSSTTPARSRRWTTRTSTSARPTTST